MKDGQRSDDFSKMAIEDGYKYISCASVLFAACETIIKDLPNWTTRNEIDIAAAKRIINRLATDAKLDSGIIALDLILDYWSDIDNLELVRVNTLEI